MSFRDIFKSKFFENNGSAEFSLTDTFLAIGAAFLLGLFIFFIYKLTYQGVMYNRQFGISLVALSMNSTLILIAVTSNVVLSLGMVGALSIVRFRTAIKDPLDIVYLFWAIGVGIVLGAGPAGGIAMYLLAIIGSLLIGLILFVFVNVKKAGGNAYILVVECKTEEAEKAAEEVVKSGAKRYSVKSKTVTNGYIEISYEVRLNGEDTAFVNQVSSANGVDKAVLVSYNGDYMA